MLACLPLSAANIPSDIPLEKTNFSFASRRQLQMAFWLKEGAYVCLRLHKTWTCAGPAYAATVFVSSCVHQARCVWKLLFLCSHPSSLAFIISLPPFPHRSLSFERRSLLRTSHWGLTVPMSLILSIVQLWLSVLVPIYYMGKLLWWWHCSCPP